MTARPGWVKAWVVVGVLAGVWVVLLIIAPDECNMIGRCDWWSRFGVILLGAPVVALAVLAAMLISVLAWMRR